jgi:ATP-dependent metalloprotease
MVQVAVPLPDVKGRAEILEYYLSDKPVAAGLDQSLLARQTSGFSGADLSNLVGSVSLLCLWSAELVCWSTCCMCWMCNGHVR